MGIFSGIFGKKEEAPPEPLVLGARLHCTYGSHDTFLYVASDNISINNLPQACVEDSETPRNVKPFGMCNGVECELQISLDAKWVNAEPQNTRVNGKEIITTKSTLTCNKTGMLIRAVTSGQDGIYAKELLFIAETEKKYPGLLAILKDPYGSLYLNEGMYEKAIQFLEDRMNAHGGSIELITLYGAGGLEGEYIRGALERLLTDCDVQRHEIFMADLMDTATQQSMDTIPGWNPNYLNPAMMELIKKDSRESLENIKRGGFYRFQEENKAFSSWLREGVDAAAYTAVFYDGAMRGSIKSAQKKPEANAKKAEEGSKPKGAVKQNNVPKIKGAKVNKGASGVEKSYSHLQDPPNVGKGKDFTLKQKEQIIQDNIKRNNGVVKSDLSGQELVKPQKSMKGVTPPKNEWQIDHVVPKDKGGTNSYSNAQVLSREENRIKWNK